MQPRALACNQAIKERAVVDERGEDLEVGVVASEGVDQSVGSQNDHAESTENSNVAVGLKRHQVALSDVNLKVLPPLGIELSGEKIDRALIAEEQDDVLHPLLTARALVNLVEHERKLGIVVDDEDVPGLAVGQTAALNPLDELLERGRQHRDDERKQDEADQHLDEARNDLEHSLNLGITRGVGEKPVAQGQRTNQRGKQKDENGAANEDGAQLHPHRRQSEAVRSHESSQAADLGIAE